MIKKSFIVAVSLLMAFSAGAASEIVDGVTWQYTVRDGKATVYVGGYSSAIPSTTTGEISVPSTLGGYPVASIGDYAFYYCTGLTSVAIPSGVTSIGERAFYFCSRLTSVTIPSGVTSIGDEAFSCCGGLTEMVIPSSVTSIGSYAFSQCSGMISFSVDAANPVYSSMNRLLCTKDGAMLIGGVNGDVTIPSGVTNIASGAFSGCSGLTSVTIPSSVTSIGENAFSYCGGLLSFSVDASNPAYRSMNGLLCIKDGTILIHGVNGNVSIPSSVTSIENYAFYNCSGLTSVTIPSSVTNIGKSTFYNCSGLTSVTIPSSVTSIENYAFYNCSGLTSVAINEGVTSIGSYAFYNCSGLTSMPIPSSVTAIGSYAFYDCRGLTSVDIQSGVKAIGAYAFGNCNGLLSVRVPSSVTTVGFDSWDGYCAFSGCDSITDAVVPGWKCGINFSSVTNLIIADGVTSIGSNAFSDCLGLKTVGIPSSVTNIDSTAFSNCRDIREFTVSSENPNYSSENGLLLSKDGKSVVSGVNGVVVVPSGVTTIEYDAFSGRAGLTSIEIPISVTNVRSTAFSGCVALKNVVVPGWKCCIDFSSVTNLVITDGTSGINGSAFSGCRGLVSVTIPPSVTYIGAGAFSGCTSLINMVLPFVGARRGNTGTEDSLFGYVFGTTSREGATATRQEYSSNYYDSKPTYYIPTSLRTIEITDESIIGYGAFYGCGGLTSVAINDGVTSIDSHAFYNCSGLTSMPIPSSVAAIGSYAFYNCGGLTSVTIPSGVPSIESYAFYNCGGLTSVTIPSSVTSIGTYAFYNCGGIQMFSVDASNPAYCELDGMLCTKDGTMLLHGVNGDVTIPSGVASIEGYAFLGCGGLMSVSVPDSVMSIGYGAFSCCASLTNMVLPFVGARRGNMGTSDSLFGYVFGQGSVEGTVATKQRYYSPNTATYNECTYYIPTSLQSVAITDETIIGYGAFYGCCGLKSVTIPLSVTSIGSYAFYGCHGLTAVAIPSSVTSIESCTFYNCRGLTAVSIPSSVTSIEGSAFCHCDALTSVTIPSSVTSIGSYAFGNCSGLTSVTISDGVTSIGDSAFYYCSELKSVAIPPSVKNIGDNAFYGCNSIVDLGVPGRMCGFDFTSVTNLVITEGTTCIEDSAFSGCSALMSVKIPSSVTNIGQGAFSGCSGLTLLLIPTNVMSIGEGAFSHCTSLTNMALPFVGGARGGDGTADSLFGYVFGTNSGAGTAETIQYYSSDSYATYFIPTSLQTVEIADENVVSYGAFYNCSGLTSVSIPEGVASIGDYAFYNCSALTSMKIPSSVTSIGESAYYGCSGLSLLNIPDGVMCVENCVFTGCSGLKSIMIPSSVTNIGRRAFLDCSGLTSVAIPDGVTKIGANAFEGCPTLYSFNIPSAVKELDSVSSAMVGAMEWNEDGFKIKDGWVLDYQDRGARELTVPDGVIGIGCGAFANMEDLECVSLPESLKYISYGAFEMDTYLDNVEIPDGVEIIGENAFKDCSYIQTIAFGKGLKKIGDRAFDGCTQFASVSFQEGLKTVGEFAFNDCWRMQSVLLPLSVESVASTAFTGCDSLTGVTVPTHQSAMSDWFSPVYRQIVNASIPKGESEVRPSMFEGCSALQTVEFVEGITNIGSRAFYCCGNLRSLDLPRSLEAIGDSAFYGCANLTSAVLPEGVAEIGSYCFYNCYRIGELTLSRSLKAIPDHCFDLCTSLRSFVVPASVTSLGSSFCPSGVAAIYYLGNAPTVAVDAYARASSSLTSYVINGTKGWDGRATSRDLPSSWPVDNSYARPIAFWSANEFDVTFDANGGVFALGETNLYACAQITYTAYSLPPYEPILGGAKFGGYWTEPSGGTRVTASTAVKLTKAHTLYAHWDVAPSITVRFNANGGTITDDTATYTSGEPYGMLPVATREHYNFAGWYTSAKGGMPVVISSEVPYADKELYAHWVPKLYEILYHSCNGKDQTVSQLFTYGDVVSLAWNLFSCEGCNFAGWALAEGGAAVYANGAHLGEMSAVQDGTIHLYAVWSGRTYAVRFDSNGGLGSMEDQTFVLGVAQHLNAAAFRREGYEFLGWTTVPSGEVVYTDGALVVGLTEIQGATVELFAVWARKGLSLFEALGYGMVSVDVSGDADWITADETTHDGVASVCNAELAQAAAGKTVATTFTVNVAGSGMGAFWWKVSCEEEYYGDWYDYAVFSIDGVEQERIAGEVDWAKVEYSISSTGAHTLTWTFVRDDFDEPDAGWENRLWLDDFVWNRDISSYTTADIFNAPDLTFTNGGDGEWFADPITNHDGVISMRSGMIAHSQQSWIETTVTGVGELSFWWKANGQVNGSRLYDYLKFEIDGELISRIGVADWTNIVASVTNAGPHKIRWTYLKNASVNPEYDCGWLDEIKWTKAEEMVVVVPAGITGKADIVIPPAWFKKYPLFTTRFGRDFAAAMLKPNGKLLPGGGIGCVWHDYVAGTDPTDVDSCFRAVIRIEGGHPKISWIPELGPPEAAIRIYKTFGKRTLLDPWVPVTDINRDECRFFKVTVEMK